MYLEFEEPIRALEKKITELRRLSETQQMDLSSEIEALETRAANLTRQIFSNMTPWQRVLLARHPQRPVFSDYLRMMFHDAVELHGDRAFGDDPAIFTGFARLGNRKLMLVATRKGKNTNERVKYNFGMPNPEGYRKAILKMQMAQRYGLPVLVLIDTPGAYPGIGAEERGQANIIAENLLKMSRLKTPVVCVTTGEGFSGGAIGIGVGDRQLILENSVFSVISPEGCAAILWKDGSRAPDAAAALKLTATDLKGFGIMDEIIEEPLGGAHSNPPETAARLQKRLEEIFTELSRVPPDELVENRYRKYRRLGAFVEERQEAIETMKPEAHSVHSSHSE